MRQTKTQIIGAITIFLLFMAGLGVLVWRDYHQSGPDSVDAKPARPGRNPNTDWLREAHYGVLIHFLPHNAQSLALVSQFDVEALAGQLEAIGARYLVFTLGQYSGYYNAPNPALDRIAGYAPGERCAARDLPLDLSRALHPKGIKLMLYLTCQVGCGDARAQKAFGLSTGPQEQPLNDEAVEKWAEVVRTWSDRYGDKVAGWWFDGGYPHLNFDDAMAWSYADAAKHGNPKAIVTFNTALGPRRATDGEDFTAGETVDPFAVVPASRWLDGSQWHVLTYLGTAWGKRDARFPAERWAAWGASVAANGGAFTLDMGPNYDPAAGPVGSLSDAQMTQVKVIQAALAKR